MTKCPNSVNGYDVKLGSHTQGCPISTEQDSSAYNNECPQSGLNEQHSKDRIYSTIPRTGSDEAWKYPSPAMFYSAVKRKGHVGAVENFDSHPSDLESIVHIHNVVNETAWQQILKYEKLTSPCSCDEPCKPSLEKFIGRANDWTIKARLNHYIFGYQLPFDRHDWYVSRCQNGSKPPMRYIIDFYSGSKNKQGPSMHLDVRPEPSISGLLHRLKMQYIRYVDFLQE